MGNSVCKYCGDAISWAQEGGRWVPLDPETGLSHQSQCRATGPGGAVKLRGLPKKGQIGKDFADNAKLAGIERRVAAIEEKLGIKPLTYNPFKNLSNGK